MKEKEYNTWLAEAKAALDGYSAAQQELAGLYQQAKANAEAEYRAQKQQLEKETKEHKNRAVVDTMKTERDLDRTLASRGLAFSGENAQTGLDLALDLRGRLAELEDNAVKTAADLDARRADTQNQLDLAYAREKSAAAEKLADMKLAFASAVKQEEEEEASDTPAEDAVPMPDLTGKSFSQRVKLLAEHAKAVAEAKKQQQEEAKYTPEISAKELAKQLVSAAGEDGIISGIDQQEAMEALLSRLTEAHTFSDGYLQELMLNLRSLGYRPDYRQDVEYGMEDLQKRSVEAFDEYYDRYYRLYRSAGYSPVESDEKAGDTALFMQFVYLYRNSRNKEMFENAMWDMGYRNELEGFYKEIERNPAAYGLDTVLNHS